MASLMAFPDFYHPDNLLVPKTPDLQPALQQGIQFAHANAQAFSALNEQRRLREQDHRLAMARLNQEAAAKAAEQRLRELELLYGDKKTDTEAAVATQKTSASSAAPASNQAAASPVSASPSTTRSLQEELQAMLPSLQYVPAITSTIR